MINTLIICLTVLTIAGGTFYLIQEYVTRARKIEKEVLSYLKSKVDALTSDVRTEIKAVRADVNTLTTNQVKLQGNQENLQKAIVMNGTSRKSLFDAVANNSRRG